MCEESGWLGNCGSYICNEHVSVCESHVRDCDDDDDDFFISSWITELSCTSYK